MRFSGKPYSNKTPNAAIGDVIPIHLERREPTCNRQRWRTLGKLHRELAEVKGQIETLEATPGPAPRPFLPNCAVIVGRNQSSDQA